MARTRGQQPVALGWLSTCYALFMVAFGGILASLVLYQTNTLHLATDTAYGVFSAAMALFWILPLGGGYLAGKLGYANAARVGLLFSALGMATFCINSVDATFLGLALFVVGNALATPAIWCMVDHCYSKDSLLREAGFTLFYLWFNLGGVIGIFAGGYLATVWGFSAEFGLDAGCLVLALVCLSIGRHKIAPHKGRSIAPQVNWNHLKIMMALIVAALIATPVTVLLFKNITVNNVLMVVLLCGMVFFLLRQAVQQKRKVARSKLIAFVCLTLIAIVFWTLYSLEPSLLSVFVDTNVDTHFLGLNIPASSYFAFDGVFVILVGLVLSRVWVYLSLKGKNPHLSVKFALSLIIIGAGFAFLAMMIKVNGNHLLPGYIVVIAYAIFSTGELLVSPLGISMVGSLAPEGQEGVMMGFWQLAVGIGGVAAGYIAMAPKLPQTAVPLAQSNPIYVSTFLWVGLSSVVLGLLVMCFVKKLNDLMKEHEVVIPQI